MKKPKWITHTQKKIVKVHEQAANKESHNTKFLFVSHHYSITVGFRVDDVVFHLWVDWMIKTSSKASYTISKQKYRIKNLEYTKCQIWYYVRHEFMDVYKFKKCSTFKYKRSPKFTVDTLRKWLTHAVRVLIRLFTFYNMVLCFYF